MEGATKYINSLLSFPNKTVNFLSTILQKYRQFLSKQKTKTTEHTEWKRDFDIYRRIMKGTANITKKYFCPCLIFSVLFIYVLLIFVFVLVK